MLSVIASRITKWAMARNAHQRWVVPFLEERNGPAYERCRSICLDGMNPLPTRVPQGHTQYSEGHTSERRALVVWIKLSITDTETKGTVPTPDLNTLFPVDPDGCKLFPWHHTSLGQEGLTWSHAHTVTLPASKLGRAESSPCHKDMSDPGGIS